MPFKVQTKPVARELHDLKRDVYLADCAYFDGDIKGLREASERLQASADKLNEAIAQQYFASTFNLTPQHKRIVPTLEEARALAGLHDTPMRRTTP